MNGFSVYIRADRKWISATDINDLVREFCDYRDDNGYGASDIGAIFNIVLNDQKIGTLSYNGRVTLKAH